MNNIKFWRTHPYVHEYKCDIQSVIEPYLPNLVSQYKPNYREGNRANLFIDCIELKDELVEYLLNLVHEYYIVSDQFSLYEPMVYYQTEKDTINQFHNHVDGLTSMTFVFYAQVPKIGGELEINHPPSLNLKLPANLNTIYAIPSWMYHRPLEHEDKTLRISINWGYQSNTRPVHKLTGDVW